MSWESKLPASKIPIEVDSGLFWFEEHLCFGAPWLSPAWSTQLEEWDNPSPEEVGLHSGARAFVLHSQLCQRRIPVTSVTVTGIVICLFAVKSFGLVFFALTVSHTAFSINGSERPEHVMGDSYTFMTPNK